MSINYLDILKKSWQIAWSNKYLWYFGFFIAVTNVGGLLNYSSDSDPKIFESPRFQNYFAENMELVGIAAILLLILFFALLILRILSRGALIRSIEKNIRGEHVTFRSGMKEGKKYFWRIFLISFLIQIAVMGIALLIITPITFLFLTKSYVLGGLLAIAGVIIIIPLIISAYFLEHYGFIYAVLGDLKISASIEKAYDLFRKNIKSSLLMGLVFLPLAIFFAVAMFILLFILTIIFSMIGIVLFWLLKETGAFISLGMGIFAFAILFLLARSFYESFYQAVWIFFFHEIASPKEPQPENKEPVAEMKPISTPDPA